MKNKWKVAALTSLMLVPAAIVYADDEQPSTSTESEAESRAILYFEKLHMDSSLVDTSIYDELLTNAFSDKDDKKRILLQAKLDYIQSYKSLFLTAESLKTEISKLTLTSKTLKEDVENASQKYDQLSKQLIVMNSKLTAAYKDVQDSAYANLLSNISKYYENGSGENAVTLIDILATLIGATNQETLKIRQIQVANVFESTHSFGTETTGQTIAQLIEGLVNVNLETITNDAYKEQLAWGKTAYATLSVDEKKIADSQVITGTTTNFKQAITNAETNVAKAAAFDAEITKFKNLSPNPTTDEEIAALKTQLVAVDKSFNSLTDIQKKIVTPTSKQVLAPFQYILTISGKMGALKIKDGVQYREDLAEIKQLMDNLSNELAAIPMSASVGEKIIPNLELYTKALEDVKAADAVEEEIKQLIVTENADGTITIPTSNEIKERKTAFNELSANQKKLVRNSNDITAWENAEKSAADVDKKIDAIVVSSKQDFYKKFDIAWKAYEGLNKEIEVYLMKKEARLNSLKYYAEIVNNYNNLKISDTNYATDIAALLGSIATIDADGKVNFKQEWTDDTLTALPLVTAQDLEDLKSLRNILLDRRDSTEIANDLVVAIDNLAKIAPEKLLDTLVEYRNQYNRLDTTAKKIVTNIKTLTEYEKQYVSAIKAVKLITALNPLTKDFVKKTAAARKAYDSLNANMRPSVSTKYDLLEEYERVSNVMQEIDNLKKSKNILADVAEAKRNYDRLIQYLNNVQEGPLLNAQLELLGLLNNDYNSLLQLALKRDEKVKDLVDQINRLAINFTVTVGNVIEQIANEYKQLSSNDKKLLTNYATFKTIEKNYKAGLKVQTLIDNLPGKEAPNYANEVEKALNDYRKLTEVQRKYVFNYSTKLEPFVKVAALIGDIESLKPTMKDYTIIVEQLRERYKALTTQEKQQVYNYNKLVAAENAALGVQNVISLINTARPGVDKYLDALQKAREAYDALSKDHQKQVTNYKDLQAREKSIKPVLELNDLITKIALQRTAKNFISQYDKAWKQLDTVSLQDRALLTNEKILTEQLPPIYDVMQQIESIKNSSKTFVGDVANARTAYNALTAEQKAKILNLALLEEHEVNVKGGAYIDELIRALQSNPPEIYVQKVQEALAAYKNLSSENKKAVTLYDVLKLEEKYIKPVQQAMEAIDLLAISSTKVDTQVKKIQGILSKLTDEQYKLIQNIDKYNALGNVVNTITLIDLIKPSDTKYYIGNTKAAEISYNRLSPDEKQRVSNYSKLEDALINVAALDQIIKNISGLSYLSPTFSNEVASLLAEYKKLPAALKKQVTNYNYLETANKDLAAANKVVAAITSIDPSVKTFESKVVAARNAYISLDDLQKSLVTNLRLLEQYERQLGL
jgi:hypothetical protein